MHDAAQLQELKTRAEQAVSAALTAGASDAFCDADRSRNVELEMRDGQLEKVQEATSRSLQVQLWVDGRYGAHATTDLRPDRLTAFLADAVALTRALEPDQHRQITDPVLYEGRPKVDLQQVDPAVVAMSREDAIALLSEVHAPLGGTPQLISATSGVNHGHSLTVRTSSNGFTGSQEDSALWISAALTLRGEGDRRPEGGMWAGARYRDDVPAPDWVAAEATRRATDVLDARMGPTKNTTLIAQPSTAGMLLARLMQPAHGSAVQQGRSFWADRVGKVVISPLLTVTDDPLLPRGFGSRLFDGEGIASRKRTMIADGALQDLYVDTYNASKLGRAPTTSDPSNRVIAPGSRGLEDLIGATSDGYLVTDWLGGNMDPTTGDFSFGMRGFRLAGGARAQAVGEMNVTGNIVDLFARLAEVGDDPWPFSSIGAPTLVFDKVQFSGV